MDIIIHNSSKTVAAVLCFIAVVIGVLQTRHEKTHFNYTGLVAANCCSKTTRITTLSLAILSFISALQLLFLANYHHNR